MSKVTLYSGPGCPYCQMVKDYLKEKAVAFEEIDLAQKPEAAEAVFKKSGQMGVPVLMVEGNPGGEKIIVGFDKGKIDEALGI